MESLRHSPTMARFVLACFALMLGLSIAAPFLNDSPMQVVCLGNGGIKLVTGDEGSPAQAQKSMDCPLCLSIIGPTPAAQGEALLVSPLAVRLQPIVAARIAAATAAPPPATGPPALLA